MAADLQHAQKLGDDIFRGVWYYFGLPTTFLETTVILPEYHRVPMNDTITFCIIKATVVDILENRHKSGLLFDTVFRICSKLNKDALRQIKKVIQAIIEKQDDCSGFISFCATICDFVLFLVYKQDCLNVTRVKLIEFWSDFYLSHFNEQVRDPEFLKMICEAAIKKAGIYPYKVLYAFTTKYCSSFATIPIPILFEFEIKNKYKDLNLSEYADLEFEIMKSPKKAISKGECSKQIR